MATQQQQQIAITINDLYLDSKHDYLKLMKGVAKSILRPMQPKDFKEAYLSISKEQGEDLKLLITKNNYKHIVEFGTSFGISTLFMAQAALESGGNIITTELIASKAQKAIENFKLAGVYHLIDVRIGNALDTLKNYNGPVDLLLLDGWKDLYLTIFKLLEPNFHKNTMVYVDNANMSDTQVFLKTISKNKGYNFESKNNGKVVLITLK